MILEKILPAPAACGEFPALHRGHLVKIAEGLGKTDGRVGYLSLRQKSGSTEFFTRSSAHIEIPDRFVVPSAISATMTCSPQESHDFRKVLQFGASPESRTHAVDLIDPKNPGKIGLLQLIVDAGHDLAHRVLRHGKRAPRHTVSLR